MWNGTPFSAYARADLVMIGGQVAFDRKKGMRSSDFELGHGNLDGGSTAAPPTPAPAAQAPSPQATDREPDVRTDPKLRPVVPAPKTAPTPKAAPAPKAAPTPKAAPQAKPPGGAQ
jgi:outer membrane biosynthesis protein TonB